MFVMRIGSYKNFSNRSHVFLHTKDTFSTTGEVLGIGNEYVMCLFDRPKNSISTYWTAADMSSSAK